MITSTKERRAFQRMVINAPVTLFQHQQVLEGVCRDLSANGMGVEVNKHAFDLAQPIRVSLATSSNFCLPSRPRPASCGCWRKKTVSCWRWSFSPSPETRAPVLLETGQPWAGLSHFPSSCTGCTLNWPLSTSVLLVGASWPMGSWAGPVGSIRR